jgi:hypothetical protein
MWPPLVVKRKVRREISMGLFSVEIVMQIDLFPFHRSPESLDEYIVETPPLGIHANQNLMGFQTFRKRLAGKLTPLIAIENLGPFSVEKRFLERLDAKVRIERIRKSPREDIATIPIQNRHQIEKSLSHPHIRYIGAPHLIRMRNRNAFQQIRIDPMRLISDAELRFWIERFESVTFRDPKKGDAVWCVSIRRIKITFVSDAFTGS